MENLFVKNDDIQLEAEYFESLSKKQLVVLICHPDPRLGGSFYNNVISAIFNKLVSLEFSCMRFNFRGVGRSTGYSTNGEGELDDVKTCLKYLSTIKGYKKIIICGYSYGAAIGCSAIANSDNIIGYVAISFPWDYMGEKYKQLSQTTKPKLFLQGDLDQIADFSKFEKHFAFYKEPKSKMIVKGADHFYIGFEDKVAQEVVKYCSYLNKI
ncbi:MAG: alpha/beta hydrolase [Promethearchaeota archaeon]